MTGSGVVRFRVHMLITADRFEVPVSFRVDAFAGSSMGALDAAHEWLRQQPLTDVKVLQISAIDRQP